MPCTLTRAAPTAPALLRSGNTVGVVPGRTNPSQGQTNPWVTPASIDVGDMYTGVVEEGTGLSRPTGAPPAGCPLAAGLAQGCTAATGL